MSRNSASVGKLGFLICPSLGALLPILLISYFINILLFIKIITNFLFMVPDSFSSSDVLVLSCAS